MANNLYVGIIYHAKRGVSSEYREKLVLYKVGDNEYINPESGKTYSTLTNSRDYVEEDSLIEINSEDFRIDYDYLLDRIKANNKNNTRLRLKKH